MKNLSNKILGFSRRSFSTAVTAMMLAGFSTVGAMAQTKVTHPDGFNPDDWVIVASVINTTNPYMISNIQGAEAMSRALGIDLEIVNSNGSSQTSISSILAILASGKKPIMFNQQIPT